MASVDALHSQEEQMRMTIDTTSSRIEALIEAAYNESADADKMKIINRKRHLINGDELF